MRLRTPIAGTAVFMIGLSLASFGSAQSRRLTDDEVEKLMEEVEKAVDRFTKAVKPQYRTATIRRATSEVSVEGYLQDLKKSCKSMRERFEDDYAASNEALACLRQATGIDRRASEGGGLFGGDKEWPRLEGTLGRLSQVYGVDWAAGPETWKSRRMNDRELVKAIEGLSSYTKSFEKSLESALKHVDEVGNEERKKAFDAIDRLESSADDLKDAVEDGRDAAGELALMRSATQQIQDFLAKHALANAVGSTWGPLEAELSKIAYAW